MFFHILQLLVRAWPQAISLAQQIAILANTACALIALYKLCQHGRNNAGLSNQVWLSIRALATNG